MLQHFESEKDGILKLSELATTEEAKADAYQRLKQLMDEMRQTRARRQRDDAEGA